MDSDEIADRKAQLSAKRAALLQRQELSVATARDPFLRELVARADETIVSPDLDAWLRRLFPCDAAGVGADRMLPPDIRVIRVATEVSQPVLDAVAGCWVRTTGPYVLALDRNWAPSQLPLLRLPELFGGPKEWAAAFRRGLLASAPDRSFGLSVASYGGDLSVDADEYYEVIGWGCWAEPLRPRDIGDRD